MLVIKSLLIPLDSILNNITNWLSFTVLILKDIKKFVGQKLNRQAP